MFFYFVCKGNHFFSNTKIIVLKITVLYVIKCNHFFSNTNIIELIITVLYVITHENRGLLLQRVADDNDNGTLGQLSGIGPRPSLWHVHPLSGIERFPVWQDLPGTIVE